MAPVFHEFVFPSLLLSVEPYHMRPVSGGGYSGETIAATVNSDSEASVDMECELEE
jgi:hypothetical protein